MLKCEGLKQASLKKNLLLGHYVVGTGICILHILKNIKKFGKAYVKVSLLILYLLKILENQMFSGIFRGYIIGTLGRNGLSNTEHDHDKKRLFIYYLRKIF